MLKTYTFVNYLFGCSIRFIKNVTALIDKGNFSSTTNSVPIESSYTLSYLWYHELK